MKMDGITYRPTWRVAAAILVGVSRGSLIAILVLLFFPDLALGLGSRLGNPLRLLRAFAGLCLAPAAAAWVLARLSSATVVVDGGMLVVRRRGERAEVPCAGIDAVVPWAMPLPCAGVWLRLKSGRRFPWGLGGVDPIALADALATEHATRAQPAAVYARSVLERRSRWWARVLSFPVFALIPAAILFRLHQWVAYGGTFGEYYMFGLRAYLLGFAVYWATCTVYLVLYAALLRAVLEPLVWLMARLAPERTIGFGRAIELVGRILYFAGVPLALLRLFLRS
jgi:apolipoprotein N-acyltransferase